MARQATILTNRPACEEFQAVFAGELVDLGAGVECEGCVVGVGVNIEWEVIDPSYTIIF